MPHNLGLILRRLANNLHTLQTDYWDSDLHVVRQSQTGVRHTTTGPSTPGDDTQLDYLNEIQSRLEELSTNVSEDLALPIPAQARIGPFWAAWLYRHRHKLEKLTWYDDLTQELTDLDSELTARIHPTQPHRINLPDYATADEIAKAVGKTPAAIRKWCTRHHITAYTQAGRVHYRTRELNLG